jgi:excisionase family DNA binding protein
VSICSTGLDRQKPLAVSVKRGRELLDIGNTKIWEMINDGQLKSIKLGGKRLIIYSSIESLIGTEAA